ncbi:ligand-dependent nuclear receptor corepressor-like protein [Neosynchiropus ocellatus]
MAAVQCSRCTAERRGFRRELDSWRYKLIHCVGFESILEGIYGSMLMRDLNLFDDVNVGADSSIPLIAQELMKKMIHKFALEYASKRQCRQKDYIERSWELSESLLSKALKDIRSGKLQVQRASLLYGIPLSTLKQALDSRLERKPGSLLKVAPGYREFKEDSPSFHAMSSMLGGDARLVLQKVAAWAEQAEIGGDAEENRDLFLSSPPVKFYQPSGLQKNLSHTFAQLRDALQLSPSPTPSLEHPTSLRIPQVRSAPDHTRSFQADSDNKAESLRFPTIDGDSSFPAKSSAPFKLRPPFLTQGCTGSANQSPQRVGQRTFSLDDSEDSATRDKDKQPRKKRGRYRQYDHELMEEAISMVMGGRMSVSKAQGVYGVPHSTLEYKVKERTGTLKNPPKKKSANFALSNSSGSGSNTSSANSGTFSSAAAGNRL